ncbi:Arginine--pyruvate transaminase AruH [Lasiodiplodia theobromae]|uniref:Arginine--pyruvate transaminase AruH n=1 Tax=Lasiodiplodia theobromae TaxID=45133 RepID=A0A5N5DJJ7_9PEZI|nr:Arginine--pyruvate transaminase AruH [Lasiodiplodia theobromae]
MVQIKQFAIERWMDDYEHSAKLNLAETCCASISLHDLQSLSSAESSKAIVDYSQKQVYGAIRGTETLRSNIAAQFIPEGARLNADNVLITNGAIQANFLALYTNVGPGDHVICHYPTYQQLYSVPESLGAEVSLWRAKEDDGWRVDIDELRALIRPNTKLIIINNPQNPTGATLSRTVLSSIVDVAREHAIFIHSDEVYRPLFHSLNDDEERPPSILAFNYPKSLATGSMSKAFSLAGIRLGWIASPSPALIDAFASARDYTTISVSQLDDAVAAFALSEAVVHNLLARNVALARSNLALVSAFVEEHKATCRWAKPTAGTTAFVRFERDGKPVDDSEFCKRVLEKTGVLLAPGSTCFGEGEVFQGFVRIGYVQDTQVMVDGLNALRAFMREEFAKVPLAA